MPAEDSLKRLGGGRWETRDGRFAIEPQSGTWVVVDNSQTDDLGLPLVRGPFGSLTAAKEAIETARISGPAESPLAERVKRAQAGEGRTARPRAGASSGDRGPRKALPARPRSEDSRPPTPRKAEPPREPGWLRDLEPADRVRARELIRRLEKVGVAQAEAIARAELVLDQPAVARLALERQLKRAVEGSDGPHAAVRAAIDALVSGRDGDLGVGWRLVDERGRPVGKPDV
jgi:hypothetical protein